MKIWTADEVAELCRNAAAPIVQTLRDRSEDYCQIAKAQAPVVQQ
jgi:hypothetical protein